MFSNSTWFNPLHAQFDSGCIIASKLEFDPATVNFKEFNYSPNEDAINREDTQNITLFELMFQNIIDGSQRNRG